MTAPPETRRLFLGIALDDETRELLAAHLGRHVLAALPGSPVPPANWHVTLRFLGATSAPAADRIVHRLAEVPLPPPFTLEFGSLGAFPRPGRAAVVWLGIGRGGDELVTLAEACDEAAIGAGLRGEDRPFHPHLTLSRVRPPQPVTALLGETAPVPIRMRVPAVTLFSSRLGRGGAQYDVADRVDL